MLKTIRLQNLRYLHPSSLLNELEHQEGFLVTACHLCYDLVLLLRIILLLRLLLVDKVVEVDFFEEARTPSQHLLEVAYVYVVLVLLAPHPVVALLASVQVDALFGDSEVLSRALCWFGSSSAVPSNIKAAAI